MVAIPEILSLIRYEAKLITYLAAKIPDAAMDWRPSPSQRSVLELLRYLTCTAEGITDFILTGGWDGYHAIAAPSAEITPATFARAMDGQIERLASRLEALTDRDLRATAKGVIWAPAGISVGEALIAMPVKFLTAYRMQLFLAMKGMGISGLTHYDCWLGIDERTGRAIEAIAARGRP